MIHFGPIKELISLPLLNPFLEIHSDFGGALNIFQV